MVLSLTGQSVSGFISDPLLAYFILFVNLFLGRRGRGGGGGGTSETVSRVSLEIDEIFVAQVFLQLRKLSRQTGRIMSNDLRGNGRCL